MHERPCKTSLHEWDQIRTRLLKMPEGSYSLYLKILPRIRPGDGADRKQPRGSEVISKFKMPLESVKSRRMQHERMHHGQRVESGVGPELERG